MEMSERLWKLRINYTDKITQTVGIYTNFLFFCFVCWCVFVAELLTVQHVKENSLCGDASNFTNWINFVRCHPNQQTSRYYFIYLFIFYCFLHTSQPIYTVDSVVEFSNFSCLLRLPVVHWMDKQIYLGNCLHSLGAAEHEKFLRYTQTKCQNWTKYGSFGKFRMCPLPSNCEYHQQTPTNTTTTTMMVFGIKCQCLHVHRFSDTKTMCHRTAWHDADERDEHIYIDVCRSWAHTFKRVHVTIVRTTHMSQRCCATLASDTVKQNKNNYNRLMNFLSHFWHFQMV